MIVAAKVRDVIASRKTLDVMDGSYTNEKDLKNLVWSLIQKCRAGYDYRCFPWGMKGGKRMCSGFFVAVRLPNDKIRLRIYELWQQHGYVPCRAETLGSWWREGMQACRDKLRVVKRGEQIFVILRWEKGVRRRIEELEVVYHLEHGNITSRNLVEPETD
jgi:hypothetical protein